MFDGGVTFEDDTEARLTRFLVQNVVPFVLHDAFTVDDDDQIVFEKGGFALAGETG